MSHAGAGATWWLHGRHARTRVRPSVSLAAPEEGDEVRALRVLLHAGEDHLRADDVLLRVDEVLEQVLVAPDDARRLVGVAVGVDVRGAALAPEEVPERRALLRGAAGLRGVA